MNRITAKYKREPTQGVKCRVQWASGLVYTTFAFFLFCALSQASELRGFNPIAVPEVGLDIGEPVDVIQPVDPRLVHEAVAKLAEAYNLGLEKFLSPDFFNRQRLLDNISNQIPRDSRLRVLSIQGIQTLNQAIQRETGKTPVRVSTVSVAVRTQLQFNDPNAGFDLREGTNEWIFTVYQAAEE